MACARTVKPNSPDLPASTVEPRLTVMHHRGLAERKETVLEERVHKAKPATTLPSHRVTSPPLPRHIGIYQLSTGFSLALAGSHWHSLAMSAQPLQLDQWSNSKAPLTTHQRASVNRLADWLHRNSQEYKVAAALEPPAQPRAGKPLQDDSASLGKGQGQGQGEDQQECEREQESEQHSLLAPAESSSSTGPVQSTNLDVSLPEQSAPLSSAQDFLGWFTQLSSSITSAAQSSHQRALSDISYSTERANSLLQQLESCQINVSELRAGSAFVHDSSTGLREQAESLLDSQLQLESLSQQVSSRLSFFTLYPYAISLLSSPDSLVVYSQEFLNPLDQLDMALLFLQQPPASEYKDAALYRMRYAQCVTRGATLAKLAVCKDFKTAGDQLVADFKQIHDTFSKGSSFTGRKGKAKQDEQGISDSHYAFFADFSLIRFRTTIASRLRPLIHELERRAYPPADAKSPKGQNSPTLVQRTGNAAEFESLLEECKAAYFNARRPLITKLFSSLLSNIESDADGQTKEKEPLQNLAVRGYPAVILFVQKELDLYHEYFHAVPTSPTSADAKEEPLGSDPTVKTYLQGLIDLLHQRLRTRVLKEARVGSLAAVCTELIGASPGKTQIDRPAYIASLIRPIIQEVQLRLIARAQAFLSSNVNGFTPKEELGHLDFPENILAAKAGRQDIKSPGQSLDVDISGTQQHRRGKSGAGLLDAALDLSASSSSTEQSLASVRLFSLSEGHRKTYYQPVASLVELLAQLQGLLPPLAFRELSNEGIEACRRSVEKGSDFLLKRKKGGITNEDVFLFLIRQFEMLREVVVSVDLALKQSDGTHLDAPTGDRHNQAGTTKESAAGSIVDLSALVGAINSLWSSTGRLLIPSASQQPSTDAADGNITNALDNQLRTTINMLAQLWSDTIALPLRVFLDALSRNTPTPDNTQSTFDAFHTCTEQVAEEKSAKIATWIEDDEVRKGLVESVIVSTFCRDLPKSCCRNATDIDNQASVRERYELFLQASKKDGLPSVDAVSETLRIHLSSSQ